MNDNERKALTIVAVCVTVILLTIVGCLFTFNILHPKPYPVEKPNMVWTPDPHC